ncbi:helix-turn-helix domain-containing protein [Gordonia aichiensis]|uniref:Putative transcriptional regulator n=1 Tax=Gordonia aichiensis NBRC 108223 TaxID=1220583 RepID=L7KKS4_9ACTN|nr:helix-turn-helix transcriptional regulator [Gordonia aichiensis]GAC49086.1 putative transcriptional regulator [Gordonia aichiensis NBRC 108223]
MAPTNDSHTHRAPEPLWREVTGRVLRRHRHERGERLIETARRAGVSSQYLSEIERGRKDASSEFLAAVAGAVGLSLLDLAREAAAELARLESVDTARKAGAFGPVALRSIPGVAQPIRPRAAFREGFRGPVALAA